MNMIKINLVPESLRKDRGGFLNGGISGYPREVIMGSLIAVLGILFLIHALLGGVFFLKIFERDMLHKRWSALEAERKIVDEVVGQISAAQKKMATVRPITAVSGLFWSKFLKDVSLSVPKGVSLKQVVLEKGILVIKGSAVSRKKNEMEIAGQFIRTLKQKKTFADHCTDVDVDYSIQRQEAILLSVANFSLKARLK